VVRDNGDGESNDHHSDAVTTSRLIYYIIIIIIIIIWRCDGLEKLFLFQVGTVAHRVPVDQAVAVPFDGGRLVVGRFVEQSR